MDNKKNIQQSQSGSGSAEQTGRDRNEQQTPTTNSTSQQKHDMASQIGEKESSISSILEMGGASGRDDSAGGSSDRMENESTNEHTDKP